jgi:hypothetical protein
MATPPPAAPTPTIFGKEPVVIIGVIASCVIAVIQVLSGQGIITDVIAGHVIDATKALTQILTILAPVIAAFLARPQVTPVANPTLPQGTVVNVVTPPASPNTTTTI